jgi:hypothetical protein
MQERGEGDEEERKGEEEVERDPQQVGHQALPSDAAALQGPDSKSNVAACGCVA